MTDSPDVRAAMLPAPGHWVEVGDELRASFVGCPDLPRMGKRLAQMKREAAEQLALHGSSLEPVPVVHRSERSFISGGAIHLALSREDTPDSLGYEGATADRWHLSISEVAGRTRRPVSDAEMAGWVIAGFPEADRYTTYTLATASARHADIPTQQEESAR